MHKNLDLHQKRIKKEIDEFESLENLFILINKKIRKGGQIIISHVQLNTSIYGAKHFFDQNIPESIPIKFVKKRYKKNWTQLLNRLKFDLNYEI